MSMKAPVSVTSRGRQAIHTGGPRRLVVNMRMTPIPTDYYPHRQDGTLPHISNPQTQRVGDVSTRLPRVEWYCGFLGFPRNG